MATSYKKVLTSDDMYFTKEELEEIIRESAHKYETYKIGDPVSLDGITTVSGSKTFGAAELGPMPSTSLFGDLRPDHIFGQEFDEEDFKILKKLLEKYREKKEKKATSLGEILERKINDLESTVKDLKEINDNLVIKNGILEMKVADLHHRIKELEHEGEEDEEK